MHNNLSRRYVCASWVAHHLSDHYKNLHVVVILINIAFMQLRMRCGFIFTHKKENLQIKPGLQLERKSQLLVFFTCNGKVKAQALPYGSNVNVDIFKRFLIRTGEKWRTLRSDPTKLREVTMQI